MRVAAHKQHQVQRERQVVQEKAERFGNRWRGDDMKVIEYQDAGTLKLAEFIQQRRKHHLQRLKRRQAMRAQQFQRLSPESWLPLLAGGNDIAPEANRVVIALIQRHAGNAGKGWPRAACRNPLADQSGLAVARRAGDERYFVL